MRHAKARLQFNRYTSWRKATLISLAKSLLIYQSIKTTKTKAYAVRPLVEKLISLGKSNTLFAKRQSYKILGEHRLVSLLFNDVAPRFTARNSGFIKIINLGNRRGDGAELVVMELLEIKKKEIKKTKKETEAQPEDKSMPVITEEKPKTEAKEPAKERPPITKKPAKKFLGGLRKIFKKERDSL